ncbi:TonB-dependent receptor [Sphingopyxis indica]|uniref:TonB-dependent receptor n=1 Tax=Sphingopyxis indica TaxID=436663 RepID=UPI00293931B0|nr:TonB-dependent receptor [Sphingopyxis indica]WOF44170.1 TonB-dependent receptor [Sphingopyxis indica]
MRMILLRAGCAMIAMTGAATLSHAQDTAVADGTTDQADAYHDEPSRDIVVTGVLPTARQDMLSGVAVLEGADLTQKLRPSIGETLARTPGVSATSFGPSASRPVLRGLQGERVRVLTDGIGSIDVSNTSADHATVVNPLLADRIEVLRGPQSLLYGSAAIGGVVNVLDKRIPTEVPGEPVHVGAIATYGSAAKERSVAGAIDVPLTGHLVVHADGSYMKSDDMRIGGYALTPELRAQALESAALPVDPDEEEPVDFAANAAVRGKLPNSAAETWTAGAGIAYIGEGGSLGIAYSHYDSLYGVPIRFATEPGQEQEAPRLSLSQDRIDARAEVNANGSLIDKIKLRFGYADYQHSELEENGEVGTTFYNKGMEGRLEFTQARRGLWSGATGAQFYTRDFNVVGEEAFLPKNSTGQWGLFTLQQLDFDRLKLEAGARFEHTSLSAKPLPGQPQFFAGDRSFDSFSGSLGASYRFADDWRFGVNVSRTERAPAAEELFANGPHAGTEAFEIGNPDFDLETAWSVEAVLRGQGTGYTFEASAYHSWFSNFIYDDRTGEIEDGLPVYQFSQADARYYGFEVQGSLTLAKLGDAEIVADGLADYTHARIVDVGPAPRIPPLRLLGGLGVNSPKIDVRGEVEWVDDQDRISTFETPTKGYTMVNAEINFRPWGTDRPLSFALSANNIFDVDARRHASFLKDYAPLAGRDIRLTARVNF